MPFLLFLYSHVCLAIGARKKHKAQASDGLVGEILRALDAPAVRELHRVILQTLRTGFGAHIHEPAWDRLYTNLLRKKPTITTTGQLRTISSLAITRKVTSLAIIFAEQEK